MRRRALSASVFQNAIELAQRFFRMRSEQSRGKAGERSIGILNFAGPIGQRAPMARDSRKIAAGNRAGPRLAGAEALEILKRLTNQWQQSDFRATPRKTAAHQNANRAFDNGQKIGRRKSARHMVGGFGAGG